MDRLSALQLPNSSGTSSGKVVVSEKGTAVAVTDAGMLTAKVNEDGTIDKITSREGSYADVYYAFGKFAVLAQGSGSNSSLLLYTEDSGKFDTVPLPYTFSTGLRVLYIPTKYLIVAVPSSVGPGVNGYTINLYDIENSSTLDSISSLVQNSPKPFDSIAGCILNSNEYISTQQTDISTENSLECIDNSRFVKKAEVLCTKEDMESKPECEMLNGSAVQQWTFACKRLYVLNSTKGKLYKVKIGNGGYSVADSTDVEGDYFVLSPSTKYIAVHKKGTDADTITILNSENLAKVKEIQVSPILSLDWYKGYLLTVSDPSRRCNGNCNAELEVYPQPVQDEKSNLKWMALSTADETVQSYTAGIELVPPKVYVYRGVVLPPKPRVEVEGIGTVKVSRQIFPPSTGTAKPATVTIELTSEELSKLKEIIRRMWYEED